MALAYIHTYKKTLFKHGPRQLNNKPKRKSCHLQQETVAPARPADLLPVAIGLALGTL
jgi:hypothetical protein